MRQHKAMSIESLFVTWIIALDVQKKHPGHAFFVRRRSTQAVLPLRFVSFMNIQPAATMRYFALVHSVAQ